MAKQQNCYMCGLSYAVFMSFGQRIKTRRGDLRMTGDDLGRRIDPPVSKQTIAHWEADRYRPHIDQVAQLCLILEVSADTLVLGISKAPSPRAAEIATLYDSLPPPEKARIEMMLNALGLAEPGSPLWASGNNAKNMNVPTETPANKAYDDQSKAKNEEAHKDLREYQLTGKGITDDVNKAGRLSKQRSNKRT